MKVLNPVSGFPAWRSIKVTGNTQRISLEDQRDLIVGLLEDWGKQRLQSQMVQTKFCTHQDLEERSSDPHR